MSARDYNRETTADQRARKARAKALTSGDPGRDGLTSAERELLSAIRATGYDIRAGWLIGRDGTHWRHSRVILKAARSWSHSI